MQTWHGSDSNDEMFGLFGTIKIAMLVYCDFYMYFSKITSFVEFSTPNVPSFYICLEK